MGKPKILSKKKQLRRQTHCDLCGVNGQMWAPGVCSDCYAESNKILLEIAHSIINVN